MLVWIMVDVEDEVDVVVEDHIRKLILNRFSLT
jgi:hypothetical protein